MQTHQIKRNHPNMKRVIVARGGKRGKTAGRGGKGQSARAGNKRRPQWRDIIKKLPKLRGRGVNQNKPVSDAKHAVNISVLEAVFSAGDAVTPAVLIEKGLVGTVSGRTPAVKILGEGEITKALKVSGFSVSASAKGKIEKAGGSVVMLPSRVIPKSKGPSSPKDVSAPVAKKESSSAKVTEGKEEKKTSSAKASADKPESKEAKPKADKKVKAAASDKKEKADKKPAAAKKA